MLDDSKLAVLLRVEMKALVEQRQIIQGKIDAIDLLLGEALLETAAALDEKHGAPVAPPKVKRGRRSNAQIAADKAAAEAALLPTLPKEEQSIAVITDEDEEAPE